MIALILLIAAASLPGDVVIEGRRIHINGAAFFARGVCDAPNPIGKRGDLPPYGDYFTRDHREIYERDLPLMRRMGVNCVRTYGWTPGADHLDFLDQAYNAGSQPIYVLVNRWVNPATDWSDAVAVATIAREWRTIAREVRGSPALLGYLIGNELNRGGNNAWDPAFWSALNHIAGAIRAEDPNHLITTPLADLALVETIRAAEPFMTNLNAWGAQAYRGSRFGDLIPRYATASGKPLLMTEFGLDAYDQEAGTEWPDNARVQADYLSSLWEEMVFRTNIVSGGFVFSWVDEWWKAGNPSIQDAGGWVNPAFPDNFANEEWWGIHATSAVAGQADRLRPRAAVEALRRLWTAELTLVGVAPDQVEVRLTGPPWQKAVLQASTNWLDWFAVATNTLPFTHAVSIEQASGAYFRAELQ